MQSYSILFFFSLVCLDTIAQWHTTEVKKNVYISLELLNPSHKFWWYSWWYSHNMQCWYIFPLLLNQIILISNSFYFATPTGWTGFFGKKGLNPASHSHTIACYYASLLMLLQIISIHEKEGGGVEWSDLYTLSPVHTNTTLLFTLSHHPVNLWGLQRW